MRFNSALACGVFALVLLAGCAGTISRPATEPGQTVQPLFLVDHGRHSSVVLVREDESMVRFAYGDWEWYAMGRSGPLRTLPTLFARTRGALGRQQLEGPATAENVRRQIAVVIREVHLLEADSERSRLLKERLEHRFSAGLDELHYNKEFDLEFVPDPRPYTLFYNSNHVVADWLSEAGIETGGNPVWGRWNLR